MAAASALLAVDVRATPPLFTQTDITTQVLTDSTTYLEFLYRGWAYADGLDAGAFYASQANADAMSPTYRTNLWSWTATRRQRYWGFGNAAVCWGSGWNPKHCASGKGDIGSHLQADLTGISTSQYRLVVLDYYLEKWRGKPKDTEPFSINPVRYEVVEYGGTLPFGKVTPLDDVMLPNYPQPNWTDGLMYWEDDQTDYLSTWILYRPIVWGVR
ncbi:MAG: hypothetical protein QME60_03090 [Verrucomicrobiota bacterium]|nr:hypothetical protein [Verrucomicrobiota bacterium]